MGKKIIIPFILITSCFALWGFANDVTNPMVKAFSKIFLMSVSEGTLVQVAFYGGYFAMAVPAAMFIRRFTYKAGVLLGLALYAAGAFMFFPAKEIGSFYPFLIAYFVLTCGLSFLETSCNPYILAMGDKKTAIRRLNLAQSFNPIGSLCGMYVAMNFIQNRLQPLSTADRLLLPEAEFEAVKDYDLGVLISPYLAIGIVILVMLVLIRFTPMGAGISQKSKVKSQKEEIESQKSEVKSQKVEEQSQKSKVQSPPFRGLGGLEIVKSLLRNRIYRNGVIAQFFYVGVQIMCWTFIIQYGTRVFMEQGMGEQQAEVLSQKYNIAAMVVFCCSRFVCTYLMRYLKPGLMLGIFAIAGVLLTAGVICLQGVEGMYCLVGVSCCMSLMFPTIYGIALKELDAEEAKFGAAGLIMAILGGSVLPPVQAAIIDCGSVWGLPAVNASFAMPLLCFVVIAAYGFWVLKQNKIQTS